METNQDKYLSKIYKDPKHPGGFAGPQKLYNAVKREGLYDISLKQIKDWLKRQDSYTLHRELRRKFPRNHIIVGSINAEWECDLADMSKLRKFNNTKGTLISL